MHQDIIVVNGHSTNTERTENGTKLDTTTAAPHDVQDTESDAKSMVIQSLRGQVQDLFSQVTQLNNKLVKSYDRVSDLEDNLHVSRSTIRSSTLRIAEMEIERTQHLAALTTGLLVEKSHVTAELTRLMEKATEEAAQRGQAESARHAIEKELDDLSANLFSQANTMVAEARYAQSLSERKVAQAEQALKGAEEAVATMQQQVQLLQQKKEESDKQLEEIKVVTGKGKWVPREPQPGPPIPPLRLLSSHQPYQEFVLFVAHLRSLHTSSSTPPAISTLLNLPFLARLLTEESEPTLRLDLAPSLNWLSRRSVLSAIHNGQVDIEPLSLTTLLSELSSHHINSPIMPSITNTHANVSCALCGVLVLSHPDSHSTSSQSRPPNHPLALSRSSSWTASNIFKNPLSYSTVTPGSNDASPKPQTPPKPSCPPLPETVHIFRLSVLVSASSHAGSVPVSLSLFNSHPSSSSQAPPLSTRLDLSRNSTQNRSQSTIYPLCTNGWCLTRLRATCSLWAFIRTGIVDKVWEEEVSVLPPVPARPNTKEKEMGKDTGAKPPLPPRRKGLWGIASALGERAASWGEAADKEKGQAKENVNVKGTPPPPVHPASQATATISPPPLPKRDQVRKVQPGVNLAEATNITSSQSQPQVNGFDAKDTKTGEKSVDQEDFSTPSAEEASAPATTSDPEPKAFSTSTEEIPAVSGALTEVPADATTSTVVSPSTLHSATLNAAPPPPAIVNCDTRSASPVPPPLPRRAAARGPGPMLFRRVPDPPVPTTVTADAEFANPGVPVASETSTKTLTGNDTKSVDATVTVTPDSMQHAVEPQAENTLKESLRETEAVPFVPPGVNSESEAKSQTAGPVEPKPAPDSSASLIDSISRLDEEVLESQKTQAPNEKEAPESKVNNDERGVYVGDATWEERTWKEVVRLREDMFWARVGGLR